MILAAAAIVVRLKASNDVLAAGDPEPIKAFVGKDLYATVDPVADVVDKLATIQLDVAAANYKQSQVGYDRVLWISVVVGALAVVLASAAAWSLILAITRGIDKAVKVAETLAGRDLSSHIVIERRDETGRLMRALQRMNASLVGIVGDVRGASESIATGSSPIATGNADLSQRTEEQASNLQQTAASMEQRTATVKPNADTALVAAQLASTATESALRGGAVVGQVAATMDEITASSKRVVDIIGVIDGIAFRTNILALNAAVEAARAASRVAASPSSPARCARSRNARARPRARSRA